jgi:tyrosyl-tRNA synthetase
MTTIDKSVDRHEIDYLLRRAVSEVIIEEELIKMLRSGKTLRLKEGLDPSAPDIHLGHMVTLRKMRQFQELGHQIVIIVGDWTARIGDPSGASATRPMLSAEQVRENADTYLKQFYTIVDKNKTEVRFQSEWFDKFDLTDVVRLTSKFTVAQFLAREDFNKRYSEGRPIAITEFLYPLMQAYDSVAIQADIELGGTDQKFNFLVGRELQSMMGQKPQQIFMCPLLVGTDGVQKMSKSLGNYICIAEPPEDIYGKIMSIRDDFIMTYLELLTDVPDEELAEFRNQLDNGINPMMLKKRLAREVILQLYSKEETDIAERNFSRVVQKKELPDDIQEYKISGDISISQLMVAAGLSVSRSEAVRLIRQNAVTVNGEKVSDPNMSITSGATIKVGKRRYIKTV